MDKTFIEFKEFTEWVASHLTDDQYVRLQGELMSNPDRGDVMPGCGGLRKLRITDPGRSKGKRGGARVIYLHVEEVNTIYFLDIYSKEAKQDLTTREKKILKTMIEGLKAGAIRRSRLGGGLKGGNA